MEMTTTQKECSRNVLKNHLCADTFPKFEDSKRQNLIIRIISTLCNYKWSFVTVMALVHVKLEERQPLGAKGSSWESAVTRHSCQVKSKPCKVDTVSKRIVWADYERKRMFE